MLDDAQMLALRDSFRREVTELLSELESSLLDLEDNPDDVDLTNRAFRALHSIKGSGAMFGFEEMSSFVHEIETVFDRVRKGELPVTRELVDLTLRAKDELSAMLHRSSPDTTPRRETADRLLSAFSGLLHPDGEADRSRSVAHETGTPALRDYRVSFAPGPDLLRTGTDPLLLLDELRALGECTVRARVERVPDLDSLVPDECYLAWDVDVRTTHPAEHLHDVFVFVADRGSLTIEPVDAPSPPDPSRSASPQRSDRRVSRPTSDAGRGDGITTVRVPSERLDGLVDLVGELVTVQARLSQFAASHGDAEVGVVAETIERLTEELRDNAMSLRTVPIRPTLARLRRVVRDLSGQLGKEVRLETAGEETELDKTVIEQLIDPLTHLVRNAIDHGLENADERTRTGKAPVGVLTIRASHEGASVVVAVSDDGRGLDTEAIRAKAVTLGIISPEAELDENETRSLVFAPGFSTASTVTDVSGRGVGMDVVKRTVDSLGGTIEIASDLGRGTSIAMRLPLTLAIIEGVLVRIGEHHYVLPLAAVDELLEFDRTKVTGDRGVRLIENRGTFLPLIDLRTLFSGTSSTTSRAQVVVVLWEGNRIGLVVDAVVGQQQTVIKSLGAVPGRFRGVSGATIMGDGSVALIVDMASLIALGSEEEAG